MIWRPKTILGNAAKWALLAPFAVVLIGAGIVLAFACGYGLASLVTDNQMVKGLSGVLTMTMALGAWMGANSA